MSLARFLVVALLVAGALSSTTVAQTVADADLPSLTRLKPADAEMRRLIVEGHARSAIFRTLVDEIRRSNAVVIVQFGFCANGRFRSCVTHVEGNDRQRHIAIKIDPHGNEHRLIASIAHELHHALEILRDPSVVNADQVLALYRRIGLGKCRAGLSEECETQAALDVEARVLDEFYAASRR